MDMVSVEVSENRVTYLYDDRLHNTLKDLPNKSIEVGRASTIEWEKDGWVVRSQVNPQFALRKRNGWVVVGFEKVGSVMVFQERDDALAAEKEFFWELLRPPYDGETECR